MGRSGAAPLLLGDGTLRARKKKRWKSRKKRVAGPGAPRRRKLTLKRFVNLIQVPEDDREERIAYVERQLAKKLEKLRGKTKKSGRRGGKARKKHKV
jgi:hypothetical protein